MKNAKKKRKEKKQPKEKTLIPSSHYYELEEQPQITGIIGIMHFSVLFEKKIQICKSLGQNMKINNDKTEKAC